MLKKIVIILLAVVSLIGAFLLIANMLEAIDLDSKQKTLIYLSGAVSLIAILFLRKK